MQVPRPASLRPTSLRASLTYRLALALLTVAGIGTVIAYQLGSRYGNQAYDRAQADDVITLAGQVELHQDAVQLNMPTAALKWLLADEGETVVYRVTDLRTGRTIDANGTLGRIPGGLAIGPKPGFRDALVNGRKMRVAYLRKVLEPNGVPILAEVGETMGRRDRMTDTILWGVLLFMGVVSLVALALVWHGVGRALSPLKLLEAEAEARSGADLAPLDPLHAPKEVRGLIIAINRMMERVSGAMESQSHFIANAAHQLRTPLSGLRLQAQLGLKANDIGAMRTKLGEVEASAVRASDLVEKLLVLAKAESPALVAENRPVDFTIVAQQVIDRFLPLADVRGVDLGLAGSDLPHRVAGSAFLLGELLGNLVDNAIQHGRQGGRVTIELQAEEEEILVAVIDDGPGFADADEALLFTRFYRHDASNLAGSGLGLAIVHEIAQRYRGRIALQSTAGAGSRFELRFPRVAA